MLFLLISSLYCLPSASGLSTSFVLNISSLRFFNSSPDTSLQLFGELKFELLLLSSVKFSSELAFLPAITKVPSGPVVILFLTAVGRTKFALLWDSSSKFSKLRVLITIFEDDRFNSGSYEYSSS
uniref:Putative secreted protein n=1 Tax=Panstrongylus lignarius TaxID=156445 RepID=A0A224XPB9_9HEMI